MTVSFLCNDKTVDGNTIGTRKPFQLFWVRIWFIRGPKLLEGTTIPCFLCLPTRTTLHIWGIPSNFRQFPFFGTKNGGCALKYLLLYVCGKGFGFSMNAQLRKAGLRSGIWLCVFCGAVLLQKDAEAPYQGHSKGQSSHTTSPTVLKAQWHKHPVCFRGEVVSIHECAYALACLYWCVAIWNAF